MMFNTHHHFGVNLSTVIIITIFVFIGSSILHDLSAISAMADDKMLMVEPGTRFAARFMPSPLDTETGVSVELVPLGSFSVNLYDGGENVTFHLNPRFDDDYGRRQPPNDGAWDRNPRVVVVNAQFRSCWEPGLEERNMNCTILHSTPTDVSPPPPLHTNQTGPRPDFPFSIGEPVDIQLIIRSDVIEILVNGALLHNFRHRVPLGNNSSAVYEYLTVRGEVDLKRVAPFVFGDKQALSMQVFYHEPKRVVEQMNMQVFTYDQDQ